MVRAWSPSGEVDFPVATAVRIALPPNAGAGRPRDAKRRTGALRGATASARSAISEPSDATLYVYMRVEKPRNLCRASAVKRRMACSTRTRFTQREWSGAPLRFAVGMLPPVPCVHAMENYCDKPEPEPRRTSFPEAAWALAGARDTGPEPVAFGSGVGSAPRPERTAAYNPLISFPSSGPDGVRNLRPFTPFTEAFGPTLVQGVRRGRHGLLKAAPAQLLTVREAAARLRVSPVTIYRLCAEGRLRHVRISNALRIAAEAVEDYLHPP